jgi:hypothetical protein
MQSVPPLVAECPANRSEVVTTALVGAAVPAADALQAALAALPTSGTVRWRVLPAASFEFRTRVDLAVCGSPETALSARARWPEAAVLLLVPTASADEAVLSALDWGAHVCVRDADSSVVAAYLVSIARRRGLLASDGVR